MYQQVMLRVGQLLAATLIAVTRLLISNLLFVDGVYGDDANPGRRGYKTIGAALAAWTAGKVVAVAPGTYAENVTVPDGSRLFLLGCTVGSGAGPAVTLASPGTGEVAHIGGWGSLAAVAALSIGAGAHLSLGTGIDLSGTISGVYRVGRRWALQSGQAIATYCPANGTIVPVVVGDRLYDGNTGRWATATSIGGTMYWLGEMYATSVSKATGESASAYYWPAVMPRDYDRVMVHRWRIVYDQTSLDSAANYFTFLLEFLSVSLASWNTQNAATRTWVEKDIAINAVISFTTLIGTVDTTAAEGMFATTTETGAQVVRWHEDLYWSEIFE